MYIWIEIYKFMYIVSIFSFEHEKIYKFLSVYNVERNHFFLFIECKQILQLCQNINNCDY